MKQKKKKNTPPRTVQVEITDISNLGYHKEKQSVTAAGNK